jgi:hypothetical protein
MGDAPADAGCNDYLGIHRTAARQVRDKGSGGCRRRKDMLTLNQLFGARGHDSAPRTYAVYCSDGRDTCPACGGRQWLVGRVSAECASCATALPLVDVDTACAGLIRGSLRKAEGGPLPG